MSFMKILPSLVHSLCLLLLVMGCANSKTLRNTRSSNNNATRTTALSSTGRHLSNPSYQADTDILANFKNRNLLCDDFSNTPIQWKLDSAISFGGSAPLQLSVDHLTPLPSVFAGQAEYYLEGALQTALPVNALFMPLSDDNVWVVMNTDDDTMERAIRTDPLSGNTTALLPMESDLHVFTEVTSSDIDPLKLSRFQFSEEENTKHRSLQQVLPEESRQYDRSASAAAPCTHYKIIQVAIAYESRFCRAMGGAERANRVVELTVQQASLKFQRPGLCTKLSVSHLEGYCSPTTDPYYHFFAGSVCNSDDSSSILKLFRNFWIAHRTNVVRDVAHLFHGFEHASGLVGCAYIGALCNLHLGYGINELTFGGNDNPTFWGILFAHELGHSAGATHDRQPSSVMDPSLCPDCDQFTDSSVAKMNMYYSGVSCLGLESSLNTNSLPSRGGAGGNAHSTTPSGNLDNNPDQAVTTVNTNTCGSRLEFCHLTPCCGRWVCYNQFICL